MFAEMCYRGHFNNFQAAEISGVRVAFATGFHAESRRIPRVDAHFSRAAHESERRIRVAIAGDEEIAPENSPNKLDLLKDSLARARAYTHGVRRSKNSMRTD